ncbi:MAG TPA: hypothetical protein VN521_09115 [Negativicutes bacterium]|nr:hypothetical protein [Negativicutes bacterium]
MGLGSPKNRDDYRCEAIDGVAFYLPHDFAAPFPLTVELHSLFGFKNLHLEGWKLI